MSTERITGAEAVVKCLLEEGANLIYGYPGGAIMPIYDELYKYQDKLHHVLTRHEQGATHAAQGFAREIVLSGGPQIKIRREGSSSALAIRKIVDLGRQADLVFVSDWRYVQAFLIPQYSPSYIQWALDEMVVAYTEKSQGRTKLSSDNVWDFLASPGRSVGIVKDNMDPCGWRTKLVWKLATKTIGFARGQVIDKVMEKQALRRYRRPNVSMLVQLLENGGVDYAFIYRSMAILHRLPHLRLPLRLNLGFGHHAKRHSNYGVTRVNRRVGEQIWPIFAERVTHCAAFLRDAPNPDLAKRFLRYLISRKGRKVLKDAGLEPYTWKPEVYKRLFSSSVKASAVTTIK